MNPLAFEVVESLHHSLDILVPDSFDLDPLAITETHRLSVELAMCGTEKPLVVVVLQRRSRCLVAPTNRFHPISMEIAAISHQKKQKIKTAVASPANPRCGSEQDGG